jgi:hypothetical protein
VKPLLHFLDIDASRFAWSALESLPLRGSSTQLDENGKIQAVAKPSDFQPIGRWHRWSFWRKRTFKRIAGRELIELGYVPDRNW